MWCVVAEVECGLHVQKLLQLLCLVEHQSCCQWALERRGSEHAGIGLSHKLTRCLKHVTAIVVLLPMPLPLVGDALEADATHTNSATDCTGVVCLLAVIVVRLVTHI